MVSEEPVTTRKNKRRVPTAPGVLTKEQAAEKAGKTERTIRNWCKSGALKHQRIGNSIYIAEADLLALLKGEGAGRPSGGEAKTGSEAP